MKIVLTLAMILSSTAAFANSPVVAFPVKCAGQAEGKNIELATSEDGTKLELAIYPANRARNQFDGEELNVTKSSPMFPVASIAAAKDLRPVDGALVEAYLAISAEVMSAGITNPARLTISNTYFDRRNGKEVKTSKVYQVKCAADTSR